MKSQEEQTRKLYEENIKLKAELKALKAASRAEQGFKTWFLRHISNFFVGRGLQTSLQRLYQELPGNVTRETMADVSSHVIWRVTRLGLFALLAAGVPLLVMGLQTYILNSQNQKLDYQNQLILNQNHRLDQQIHLDEANRRSSFIFLMDNILDQISEEMRVPGNRRLSDALIGRIVSLTQSLRPYRYLENDQLTPRQLSPERGQLLFALTNSGLEPETYDKIYARANFSYADLREANFSGAYLRRANLAHSYFSNADFSDAEMEGVNLRGAYLEEALFENTHMPGIQFQEANLQRSKMINVVMTDANLQNCDLREIYLNGDFSRCNLEGILIKDAELGMAQLDGSFFYSASWFDRLPQANLRGAFAVGDHYELKEEIVYDRSGPVDTLYVLRARPESQLQIMSLCEQTVLNIVHSTQRVQKLLKELDAGGRSFEITPIGSPFGSEISGVKPDSVYAFRISELDGQQATPVLWVEFDPRSLQLWEVTFGAETKRTRLPVRRQMLNTLPTLCEGSK